MDDFRYDSRKFVHIMGDLVDVDAIVIGYLFVVAISALKS